MFIYKALAEWVQFGETDIDVSRLADHCRHLALAATATPTGSTGRSAVINTSGSPPPPGATRMFMEFKRLSRTLESAGQADQAQKEQNVMKNRSQSVVPFDHNRIVLAPVAGAGDVTYINASLIKVNIA